ncbi:MAG: PrsW family glutamic-type intramembrane protease [Clostridia bacterium]
MIYAENILVFLVAPFIIGLFLLKGESRRFVAFFLVGSTVCLLSSYINSFIAGVCEMSSVDAIIKVTPMIEEVMKALPLLFYMIIFVPKKDNILMCSIATGIGFATFENCCYVVTQGADDFYFVLIRGFAVGIMHILCSLALGYSLGFGTRQKHFSWLGVFASVSICISYHAIYNLLVSGEGAWQFYGYFMPFVTAVVIIIIKNLMPIIKNK